MVSSEIDEGSILADVATDLTRSRLDTVKGVE